MFPDVLIIGLAHRREWHEHLVNSLSEVGFTNVSVMEAVDWRDLSESPPWVVGDHAPVYPYPDWRDPYTRRVLTLGEVGCALSHIFAWHHIAETDRPALILEEDAILVEDLVDQIPRVIHDLSHIDYSVCYFYQHVYEKLSPLVGRFVHSVDDWPVSALAYMVSPLGARTVLSSPWRDHLVPSDILLPAAFGLYTNPSLNALFTGSDSTPQSRGRVVSTLQPFFMLRAESWTVSQTVKSFGILEKRDGFLGLTVADEETENVRRLLRSARRYGYSFEVVGLGGAVDGGGGWRVNALRSRLADVPSDTVVLCTVAEGGVVSGYVGDLVILWRDTFGSKIVFAASRVCLPDDSVMELYPPCETPYRFLDCGIFMGTAGDLRLLLQAEISDDGDERRYYTELFLGLRGGKKGNGSGVLSDKIILDTECILFQSLHGSLDDVAAYEVIGRIRNERMKSWPYVVHAGGSEERAWLEGGGRSVGGRYLAHHGFMDSGIAGI